MILDGSKSPQTILINIHSQRITGGHQNIYTEVKLESVNNKRLMEINEILQLLMISFTVYTCTFEMYCWTTQCSPALISLGLLKMKIPLPWLPLSGLEIKVVFFLLLQNA